MKFLCCGVLAVTVPLCLGQPALSATITSMVLEGHATIRISGQIGPGDADVFMKDLAQSKAAGKPVETVELNSTGGKLIEGATIAAAIKRGKIATSVDSGAVCASACFLAFAAGNAKFAGPGALIGVHKASEKGGRETELSGEASRSMGRFARELGVPSWIVDRMLATSPKKIAWLAPQDLQSMGVTTPQHGQGTPTAIPGDSAQSANLTSGTNAATWNDFIDAVAKLSAGQNGGNPALSRFCQPQLKNCIVTLAYKLKDGRQRLAAVIKDPSGKTLRREICEFNDLEDQRLCMEWDTGAKRRDARNTTGDWVKISDE
jgi:hypothetical protein